MSTTPTSTEWIVGLPIGSRIYVAGHRGLVGSAIVRALRAAGHTDIITRTRSELDLRDNDATARFFVAERPDVVVVAAAKVGGINANSTLPMDFLSDNLRVQTSVLDAAAGLGVERLLFLGSSCIYPKFTEQPIVEDALLSGSLEPTNQAYAIAKIAGLIGVQSARIQYGLPWISAMPTNLYGPGDNFASGQSHLLPALIRRYDDALDTQAPSVTNWGSGTPRRELLHVDDLASACLHLLEHYDGDTHINIGTGVDHSVAEIAEMVSDAVGYRGVTEWDTDQPDGTPRKLLNVERLTALGWKPSIDLRDGIESTVRWYRENQDAVRF